MWVVCRVSVWSRAEDVWDERGADGKNGVVRAWKCSWECKEIYVYLERRNKSARVSVCPIYSDLGPDATVVLENKNDSVASHQNGFLLFPTPILHCCSKDSQFSTYYPPSFVIMKSRIKGTKSMHQVRVCYYSATLINIRDWEGDLSIFKHRRGGPSIRGDTTLEIQVRIWTRLRVLVVSSVATITDDNRCGSHIPRIDVLLLVREHCKWLCPPDLEESRIWKWNARFITETFLIEAWTSLCSEFQKKLLENLPLSQPHLISYTAQTLPNLSQHIHPHSPPSPFLRFDVNKIKSSQLALQSTDLMFIVVISVPDGGLTCLVGYHGSQIKLHLNGSGSGGPLSSNACHFGYGFRPKGGVVFIRSGEYILEGSVWDPPECDVSAVWLPYIFPMGAPRNKRKTSKQTKVGRVRVGMWEGTNKEWGRERFLRSYYISDWFLSRSRYNGLKLTCLGRRGPKRKQWQRKRQLGQWWHQKWSKAKKHQERQGLRVQ